jgi:hypothetical protein
MVSLLYIYIYSFNFLEHTRIKLRKLLHQLIYSSWFRECFPLKITRSLQVTNSRRQHYQLFSLSLYIPSYICFLFYSTTTKYPSYREHILTRRKTYKQDEEENHSLNLYSSATTITS